MNATYAVIDNLGYQDMPKQAYKNWLHSIDVEKKSQVSKARKDRMLPELQHLKVTQLSLKGSKSAN